MTLSVNRVSKAQNISTSFRQNKINQAVKSDNSGSTAKTAALLGLTALGIIGASFLSYRKGKTTALKGKEEIADALDKALKSKEEVTNALNNLKDKIKNLKSIDITDFKAIGGKFEKGKATVDGAAYTGDIITKTGKTTYNRGFIGKAVINRDGKTPIVKFYGNCGQTVEAHYDDAIVNVIRTNNEVFIKKHLNLRNKDVIYETNILPGGKIERFKHIIGTVGPKGKKRAIEGTKDLNTGKVTLVDFYDNISQLRPFSKRTNIVDGKKVKVLTSKDGTLYKAYHTEFDPIHKTYTQHFYKVNNDGKLVPLNEIVK